VKRGAVLKVLSALVSAAALIVGVASPAFPVAGYEDVPRSHWAAQAVRTVSGNGWFAPKGTLFRPEKLLTRLQLARALVRAFPPDHVSSEPLVFEDLSPDDPGFEAANLAVAKGWQRARGTLFDPAGAVTKRDMDRAIVRALGLRAAELALDRLADRDGERLAIPKRFGALVLGDQLYLHYNHPSPEEGPERLPRSPITRADAAYALAAAAAASSSWLLPSMDRYTTIALPRMNDRRRAVVEFGLRWTGWAYVYGGEWHRPTPDGYCCGAQTVGGFDCSGFVWWTLRRGDELYDNTNVRPYRGWTLDERTASTQAAAADTRIKVADLKPGDIVFFDTDGEGSGWHSIDHSGVALGNGWMVHSSGGRAGVTVDKIDDGWWRDAYKWGRRVIGT